MATPGENFVLRLLEAVDQPNLVHMNVLDVAVAGVADTVALVEWAYGIGASPRVTLAGFSVLRFDLHGNLMWQLSRELCTFNNLECGQWEIEGHLARTSNGVIVAGSGTKIDDPARKALLFAMRIDDVGAVLWARTYAPKDPIPEYARIASIAPMSVADHFLIAANTFFDDDAWLFEIDGGGKVVNSALMPFLTVRRLRATPTQGIFAVGSLSNLPPLNMTHAAILNIDPARFSMRWQRNYFYGGESFLRGVRWFDIAEGDHSLLVVGNFVSDVTEVSPMMAFVETDAAGPRVGDVRSAFVPAKGDHPVRLRGVASFVEEIVPLAGAKRKARFAVSGDVEQQPWQFLIDENGVIEWQKSYRISAGATGKLAPIRWPAFQHILAGGSIATGSRQRGFLTSSPLTPQPSDLHCSTGIAVDFLDQVLYQQQALPELETLTLEARDCYHDAGPLLRVKKGCLDSQE